jgi:rubrerythrin
MEKDSVDFYTKAKEETEIEQARKLYDTLIKWERVHLEQFTEQYNLYKEDWWADQGFAPF